MRVGIGVCLLLAVLVRPAAAQQVPPDHYGPIALFPYDKAFTLKIQSYYLRPSPRRAIGWFAALDLRALSAAGRAHGDPHVVDMLAAFYIQVLRHNPEVVEKFAQAAIASGRPLNMALAYFAIDGAGLPNAAAARRAEQTLFAAAPAYRPQMRKIAGRGRMSYLTGAIRLPTDLDIMWACYFASGNPAFLERIAGMLEYWRPPAEAMARGRAIAPRANRREPDAVLEIRRLLIAAAAYRFLRNNSRYYPRIAPGLARLAARRSDKVGRVLRRLLAEARALDRRLGKPPMPPAQ
jgi:hypothetical protein